MADLKISQLPAATTPLVGTELVPIVQSGVTDQTTVSAVASAFALGPWTANGVLYAPTTTTLATGSALTFTGTALATTGTATAAALIPSGSSVPTNGMYLPTTNALGWATNSGERMRLSAAGGLSIGATTDPGAGNLLVQGSLGLGTVSFTATTLHVSRNITGATTAYQVNLDGVIQSDVTGVTNYLNIQPNTQATSFSISEIHGVAVAAANLQSGSSASNMISFYALPQTSATTNYQFFSANAAAVGTGKTAYAYYTNMASATGGGTTWAFYAAGTAPNYMAGNLGVGMTSFGTGATNLIAIGNSTAPSSSPAGGGQLYVEAGALKYRGSSGTITVLGAA